MEQMFVTGSDAAAVAGIPRGSFGSLVHRGHVPAGPYDLADCMSLTLAHDLCEMGVQTTHAAAIGQGARSDWAQVVSANSRRFLLARRGDDGRWAFCVCGKDDIPQPAAGGTIVVDLTNIAKRVLARLRELQGA
jgi:hypothetical protein